MNPIVVSSELRVFLDMLNQVFEIEKKLEQITESNSIHRNLRRLKTTFESSLPIFNSPGAGFVIQNPMGEAYDETRADCEASIAGDATEDLVIIDVIKPIIHFQKEGHSQIVQKGVVVVKSKSE